jgi:diguanylate cyclase (GGDEF)-like protein
VGLVLLLAASKLEWLVVPMRFSVLPEGWFGWIRVAQPAFAVFLATAGFMGTRLVLRPNATGRGFLWCSAAAFLALNVSTGGPLTSVYLFTGSAILVLSVIEASYFMAYRDGLTGLPARRALNEELLRLNGQYTIAMVDVDHFKKFNDDHGHEVGDQVLRMVARELERVGGGGTPYRYGGEEFALLFPGKSAEEVVPHLERVRESIETARFTLRGAGRPRKRPENPKPRRNAKRKRVSVTVSIGAAGRSDRRSAPSEVASFADKALYRAKKTGRNRVKVAGGEP